MFSLGKHALFQLPKTLLKRCVPFVTRQQSRFLCMAARCYLLCYLLLCNMNSTKFNCLMNKNLIKTMLCVTSYVHLNYRSSMLCDRPIHPVSSTQRQQCQIAFKDCLQGSCVLWFVLVIYACLLLIISSSSNPSISVLSYLILFIRCIAITFHPAYLFFCFHLKFSGRCRSMSLYVWFMLAYRSSLLLVYNWSMHFNRSCWWTISPHQAIFYPYSINRKCPTHWQHRGWDKKGTTS